MKNSLVATAEEKKDEYGYDLAYKIARQRLAETGDLEPLRRHSGAECQTEGGRSLISLDYLSRRYQIRLPEVEISVADGDEEVPLKDRILLLHYLLQAKGTPLANKTIAYKELPEGIVYFRTFHKRAIKPLVDNFGDNPQKLLDAARALGGVKADYGDVAVTINAFEKVPITFVLWKGDEEFPPDGSILFDATVTDYLSIEDINVLSERIAWKLVRALKEGS
ncbi:MAG: DUF3786 domain-containing protein [Dehalococcoidia bacterium]|jgi:hypothetical protein